MHGMLSVMAETANVATASGVFSDITSDTFSPLVAEIKSIVPVLLGVTVTLGGIRKAWSWLRSVIRGA